VKCPFCAENVHDNAIVCKSCRHDLTYVKSLQAELRDKTARIAELEQALASAPASAEDAAGGTANEILATVAPRSRQAERAAMLGHSIIAFLVPFALLLATHYAFVFWWDLNVVLLRAALILIPVLWGVRYAWLRTIPLAGVAALALALGIGSVLAMLTLTAWIDGVPILPHTAHDRTETIQVIASITLGFGCGVLIARAIAALRARADSVRAGYSAALGMVRDSSRSPEKIGASADMVQKLAEFAAPIVSGAGAVIAAALSLMK